MFRLLSCSLSRIVSKAKSLKIRLYKTKELTRHENFFAGEKSEMRCWVLILQATFSISEIEAIKLLAQAWPKQLEPLLSETIEFGG